jgi:branched-chain amino acid transport system substrate-binding protein
MQILVLGPIGVLHDGQAVSIAAGKQRALLAALLVDADRSVSADVLVERLWGERPPATAAKNLQVLVSQLRKALGEGAIVTEPGGYRLCAGDTDAARFDALVARGRGELAEGEARDALRTFDEALALWRGRPYEDVIYEDFVRDEAARLEERRLEGEEERFDALLADGRHLDALPRLERLAAEHPLRERLQVELILALHRAGRRAEALAAYDRARQRMSEELGIEPGERLRRLHAAVLEDEGGQAPADELRVQPTQRRRSRAALAAGAGLVLLAAAAAFVAVDRSGGDTALTGVPGDHVGLVDARTGAVQAAFAVGATPTSVVAGADGVVYALNADSGTLSRVDLDSGEVVERSPGVSPADLAFADGALWLVYTQTGARRSAFEDPPIAVGVMELDPGTLRERRRTRLPGLGGRTGPLITSITAGEGAVWAIGPAHLYRIDPATMAVTPVPGRSPDAMLAAGGSVWAVMRGSTVVQIDPSSLRRGVRLRIPSNQGLYELAYGDGSLWGAEPFGGQVWRIDLEEGGTAHSIRVGLAASDVAYDAGSVWAASGIDGTVTRIDPRDESVETFAVGNAPQRIAAVRGGIVVSVAGGGGPPIATDGPIEGLETLPSSSCGPAVYGGEGPPDLLIASDLPLDPRNAVVTQPMVQAIEFVLREHGFRAGDLQVAFQSCDDATAQVGDWDSGKCEANAQSYVDTPSVVGVIGTFNSGCALLELPILNAADPPVAMVSPTNSYVGLTKETVGTSPGDPDRLYPSGAPNYVRVYPADDVQALAQVELAKRLGVQRAFVFLDEPDESYSAGLAHGFTRYARDAGMRVVGPVSGSVAPARLDRLTASLAAGGVDGAVIAGVGTPRTDRVLIALRDRFGPRFPIILGDAFIPATALLEFAGPKAAGSYVTGAVVTDPERQLPETGRRFMREFEVTQPDRIANIYTPYAAQATEVLLEAIARSDGTRGSVVEQLRGVRIEDGILGTFGFDEHGDMTANLIPIYRTPRPADAAGGDEVYGVIALPLISE